VSGGRDVDGARARTQALFKLTFFPGFAAASLRRSSARRAASLITSWHTWHLTNGMSEGTAGGTLSGVMPPGIPNCARATGDAMTRTAAASASLAAALWGARTGAAAMAEGFLGSRFRRLQKKKRLG